MILGGCGGKVYQQGERDVDTDEATSICLGTMNSVCPVAVR